MALKLGALEAVIGVDDKPFEKGLGDAKKRFEGFGDKLKAGGALIGAAVGAALAAGVASTLSMEVANDKLAAQLGLTGPESARLGKIAGDLYSNAYGESLGQVNDAIKAVTRNLGTLGDNELQGVTASVLDIASAFDVDVNDAARATAKLLKTGLAKDATEALDLITRGFQSGADEAGDLLDTIDEYSTQFRAVGLDGAQAMGLIQQGLKAGARDGDVVADTIKEINDRVKQGDAADGLKALGLNAKTMAADFAAGGDRAAGSLDTILDRLRGVKDPAKQAEIASAIAGEKFVDLQGALFALDPSEATKALGDVDGAAKKMGNTLSDNAGTKLESFKRKAQAALVEKLAEAIPFIEKTFGWLQKNSDWVVPLATGLGILAGTILAVNVATKAWAAAEAAFTAVKGVSTAAQWLWNAALLASPITWIIIGIVALVAVIVLIGVKTTWFQDLWNTVWGAIKSAAQAVGEWFAGPFAGFFVALWNGIVNGVVGVKDWIVNTFNTVVGFVTGVPGRIASAAGSMWDAIRNGVTAAKDWAVGKLNDLINWVTGLPGRIKSAASGMFDGIKDAFKGAINWLIGKWNDFHLTLGGGSILGMDIPSITLNTPNIPMLAQGGVVTRGGRAVVGDKGAEVVDLPPGAAVYPHGTVPAGSSGITVEHLEVKAYSDRFSLRQVQDDLAMHGVH